MQDPTESIRRARIAELNQDPTQDEKSALAALQERYGRVWTRDELREEFEVTGFMAPLVVVRRKADGKVGSLEFTHSPRFYFNWVEDK